MHSTGKWSFVLVFSISVAGGNATAQQSLWSSYPSSKAADSSPAGRSVSPRMLTPTEGLAILGAALESRHRLRADCSHLVQAIYESAGFAYPYATSADLYDGAEGFQRVTTPQSGDLVVWPGHVGIVVNPAQQSFYSALRSGLGVESYASSYWKNRGRARFFRYLKPGSEQAIEHQPAATLLPVRFDSPKDFATVVEERPISLQPQRVQLVRAPRPSRDDVLRGLSAAFLSGPDALQGSDLLSAPLPVIVFSGIEVKSVKVKGDIGKAEIRIAEVASISNGQANVRKRQDTQAWPLHRRDSGTWELSLPQNALYVSADAAIPALARRLAAMAVHSGDSADRSQEIQLARMLNVLLSP
jgi:hypothetical protein